MHDLVQIIVPVAICVVLPVMIVWLVCRTRINADNKRTELLLEAIRSNANVDTDSLIKALERPQKTPEQIRAQRLLYGGICSLTGIALGVCNYFVEDSEGEFLVFGGVLLAIGIAFLIVYFATKPKQGE